MFKYLAYAPFLEFSKTNLILRVVISNMKPLNNNQHGEE